MNRIVTAAITAAVSLSTTAAVAQSSTSSVDPNDDLSPATEESSVNPQNEYDVSVLHWNSNAAAHSSFTAGETDAEPSESSESAWDGIFGSAYDNDDNQGWAPGFTADVLAAGFIAFGIGAFNGFIPGIEAPGIPTL